MITRKSIYDFLGTPAVLIDLDKLEANIIEMSRSASEAGVKLRPHTKVHQSAEIARMQIEAGACGIETGSLEQAEALATEGIDDIVVAHPFCGSHKLEILKRMVTKPGLKITVVVDMIEQAVSISQVGQATNRNVPTLIKLDTNTPLDGIPRFGVLPGKPLLDFAIELKKISGVNFVGLYAHEMGMKPTTDEIGNLAYGAALLVSDSVKMLQREGFNVEHASVGASATFRTTCRYIREGKFPEITEIHPGTCIIGDVSQISRAAMTEDECALTVLTSVISTSHPEHAIIDAGHKTFGADSLISMRNSSNFFWKENPSYGLVRGRPDLWLGRLSAETSIVYYKDQHKTVKLGECLEIIPNNSIIVINLHEKAYGIRKGEVEKVISITGRGCGS